MGVTLLLLNFGAFCLAVAMTSMVARMAHRVSAHSVQTESTPPPSRLGGLAVALAFIIPLGTVIASGTFVVELTALQLLALCSTTMAVVALGLYDDLFDTPAAE